ncbi:TatD family hydrolase [Zoogloeaceae bacterium G21618-S1]|nr:TatD family hydrolase [Zoogloeaceae bacterium G21618-S1]
MLIDTHIHLDADEFAPDRQSVIDAARAAGVGAFVVPAVTAAGFDALDTFADATPNVARAYGLHPLYIDRATQEDLELLALRLARPEAAAVGEIGLDGYIPMPGLAAQLPWFEAQLTLAKKFDLPVILHVRHAVEPIIRSLKKIGVGGGIAHAFNGSRQQADTLLAMGFKLGFGGTLTYAGSRRIRALAASLPLDAIVLETDAPDMPPEWARGQRNAPINLVRIAKTLADLRGELLADVIAATEINARRALPRLSALLG